MLFRSSQIVLLPQILVVHPSLPAKSVKDLIALANARPGQVVYASGGIGATSHIAAELFMRQAGVRMNHIPYKGNAPGLVDVLGGQVSLIFDTISTSIGYAKNGRLRALGVTSPQRTPLMPDVPTIAEAGLPGYEASEIGRAHV